MLSDWINRHAARRLLRVLHSYVPDGCGKTADQLTAEGFLWLVLDNETLAERFLSEAARARYGIKSL